MNAMIPPMPPSLWAATAPPPPATDPLVGEARTGVAVVGGGFTGLSVALHLAEAGVPVTLLEAAEIGWGASGRPLASGRPCRASPSFRTARDGSDPSGCD